jgi:hypothetical protein
MRADHQTDRLAAALAGGEADTFDVRLARLDTFLNAPVTANTPTGPDAELRTALGLDRE